MKKKIFILLPAIFILCSEISFGTKITDEVKLVIEHARSILNGEIVKIEKKFKSGNPLWEVTMLTSGGGKAVIDISCKDPKLLNISAPEGPYDYSVNTGYNFISFSEAKNSAEAHAGEPVLKWVLKEHNGKWEYNFWHFTKTGRAQVRVDAETGKIITKQTKGKKKT
jgi:hypothetical protein